MPETAMIYTEWVKEEINRRIQEHDSYIRKEIDKIMERRIASHEKVAHNAQSREQGNA